MDLINHLRQIGKMCDIGRINFWLSVLLFLRQCRRILTLRQLNIGRELVLQVFLGLALVVSYSDWSYAPYCDLIMLLVELRADHSA